MIEYRQFKAPTFQEINLQLNAFYYLYQDVLNHYNIREQECGSPLLAQNSEEIRETFQQISRIQTYLRKKLRIYDIDNAVEHISIRTFQAIMKLPPSMIQEIPQKSKRKNTYVPRQRHRGPYRSYSAQEKNHVVYLNNQGLKYAAISKRLGIPQKNIVRWCREGFIVREVRRKSDTEMEEALIQWILQKRKTTTIKHSEIQAKAKEMASNSHFKASRGWLKNFLKRLEKAQVRQEEEIES